MAVPNVDVADADRDRIRRFAEHTDMRKYVHDFIASRLSSADPPPRRVHPDPRVETPVVTVPRPSASTGRSLTIQVVRACSFIELMDPDPAARLILDVNVAGNRWRTQPAEAEVDPSFYDTFTLELTAPVDELIASGAGSIVAVVVAGPAMCIYGTGFFDWRRALSGYAGLPVALSDPRTGDECGVVHLKLTCAPPLVGAAELEEMLRGEAPRASHICRMSSRLIPTPFHALRFAGLLGVGGRTVAATGNVVVEDEEEEIVFSRGFSIHGVLAARAGSGADVCGLLCSLLCGFGFEAFVCGKKVLSVHPDRAILWDPFKCRREIIEKVQTTVLYGYCCRLEPIVEDPSAQTSDPRVWRRFELPPPLSTLSLMPCTEIDEIGIENDVRRRIVEVRHTKKTLFDDQIAAAMRPLLHSYEGSKLNESCDAWTPHVNDAIRHLIPPMCAIRVAPLCVHAVDGKSVFMALQAKGASFLRHPEAEVFIVSLALFPYAEDLAVCWCLFGVILPQTK
jgi:hypothetical protein